MLRFLAGPEPVLVLAPRPLGIDGLFCQVHGDLYITWLPGERPLPDDGEAMGHKLSIRAAVMADGAATRGAGRLRRIRTRSRLDTVRNHSYTGLRRRLSYR